MRRYFAVAAVLAATAGLSRNADAVPITVTGGFTSFDGVVLGSGDNTFALSTLNGNPLCAVAGCATTGAAHVVFGSEQSSLVFYNSNDGVTPNLTNIVSFTPAAAQDVTGHGVDNAFLLGKLVYENGIWSGDATFGFKLTAQAPIGSEFDGLAVTDVLTLKLTSNDFVLQTPDENADFVYFSGTPAMGSIRAYELADSPVGTNRFEADVYGYFDSLHLLAFANGSGGGFIDGGIDIKPTPPPTSVPEPGSLALLAAGLLVLGAARSRRPS